MGLIPSPWTLLLTGDPTWSAPVLTHILTAEMSSSQVCSMFDKAACLARLGVLTK